MPLTSTDLVTPAGEIDGALFYPSVSSGDVATRLGAYLTQAYAFATAAGITDAALADRAARAFAYYRAWSDVVNRLTITPASTSLAGEVSTSYLQSQIDAWIVKRDAWLAIYEGIVPSTASLTPTTPISRVVRTQTVF